MSRYTGIHHLAFATPDMEVTVWFWRDLLGMRLVYATGHPGYRQYFFEVSQNDLIAFFEWPEVEKPKRHTHGLPVKGPFSFDHVAIGVESEAALWEVAEKLTGGGFAVSDMVDHGFIRSLYAFDPNGIPIEFTCPVPGIDVRAKPVLADRDPCPSRLEGSDPQPGRWPPAEIIPEEERAILQGDGWENFHGRRRE
ncbi:MAG: VOC family protein [Betaproteobacteria bacterium]|nr:VOC family protein [Betaproteobacteria bacterium]